MDEKIKNDSFESQNENKSTVVDNQENESGAIGKAIGCFFEIIGISIMLLITSYMKTCIRMQLSSNDTKAGQIENIPTNTIESQIQSEISHIIVQLPMRLDDITTLVDVKCTETAVSYVYEIKDNDFDLCDLDKAEMKSQILAEWGTHDKKQKLMAKYCVETNRSVAFQYKSINTGKSFTLTFSPLDLKSKI